MHVQPISEFIDIILLVKYDLGTTIYHDVYMFPIIDEFEVECMKS